MDASQARPTPPEFDPVRADWLPIQIYESNQFRARMGVDAAQPDGWQVLHDPSWSSPYVSMQDACQGILCMPDKLLYRVIDFMQAC